MEVMHMYVEVEALVSSQTNGKGNGEFDTILGPLCHFVMQCYQLNNN